MTVYAYRIKISDQIYATTLIDVTPEIEAAMTAAGIEGAGSIDQLNYFQNAFDSTVQGVDVVASYRANLIEVNPTTITAAFNLNTYKIDRVNISSVSFNEVSIYNFKHNAPKWRGNLTLQQDFGPINVMARGNLYGPYSRQTTRAGNAIQHYDPEIMLDLEISAPLGDGYTVAIGARNLFDNYPATNKIDDTNGRTFVDGPVDWQGGYYFGRLAYSF